MVYRLVLFGAPGAGKGTQARKLSEAFGLVHLSTGEVLRAAIAQGTPMGLEAKRMMDAGALVPDAVVNGIVKEALDTRIKDKGFVLDGFPRTVDQAKELDTFLCASGRPLSGVIDLEVAEAALVARLADRRTCPKCQNLFQGGGQATCPSDGTPLIQRADDAPEAIRTRFEAFERQTLPVRDFYAQKGVLVRLDGSKPPAAVFEDIASALGKM